MRRREREPRPTIAHMDTLHPSGIQTPTGILQPGSPVDGEGRREEEKLAP